MSAELTQRTIENRRKSFKLPWERWGLDAVALSYLVVLLVIPLLVILKDGLGPGLATFWKQISQPVALSALGLTLWTAFIMTLINTVMGLMTAYVLVREEFPGKKVLNSIIDLPLAIPSLVTGVMLVVLFGPQQAVGAWLKNNYDFSIIFAPPGIILAMMFITFPFVVRAVQPVILELDQAQEQAAATLGASAWVIFRRIVFPPLLLPLTTGALLSFARAVGEFGAIVIVAGNIPLRSLTAAVYVLGEVESENRIGASAVSLVMIAIALILVLLVNQLQKRYRRMPR